MKRKLSVGAAVLGISALILSGCGAGDDSSGQASGQSQAEKGVEGTEAPAEYAGAEGGEVTKGHCQPQNPLIPGMTQEVCGGDIIDSILVGLTQVDPETVQPVMANAESIEANEDQSVFTVTLKDWNFDDGTPVTASSYVDAWNYSANAANAQLNQSFFGPGYLNVKGYDQLASTEDASATLSGLTVVDDSTFRIETEGPNSLLQTMLVHSAFVPLPDSFFDDPEAYGQNPIGNGPFKVEEVAPEQQIVLAKNTDYQGDTQAKVDRLTLRIYTDAGASYPDVVAGNVDYVDSIPPDATAGDKWKTDLGDGRWRQGPSAAWNGYTFPQYVEEFKDPNMRKAISMGIDRQAVIDAVQQGANTPATAWSTPTVQPYDEGICGDACQANPEEAKRLLDEAGGFNRTLQIAYNADSPGNKEVTEAVCTSINENLGIDCQAQSFPTFAEMLDQIDAKEMPGMYRSGWQPDYPSPLSYLTAYYVSDASSNRSDYSNPEYDQLASDVLSQDEAARADSFQKMQQILATDLPVTPLWYNVERTAWSDRVVPPKLTWKSTIDFTSIGLKQ